MADKTPVAGMAALLRVAGMADKTPVAGMAAILRAAGMAAKTPVEGMAGDGAPQSSESSARAAPMSAGEMVASMMSVGIAPR